MIMIQQLEESLNEKRYHQILERNTPLNYQEKELPPTFEGLVSASFHGLYDKY